MSRFRARSWAAVVGVPGALLWAAVTARAATVEGAASVDGRPASHAVIYLESVGAAAAPAGTPVPAGPVIMDQKNLTFVPDVLPVVRGTAIEFTNSDDVQHNVFSPSAIAGKFNLGTYGPGATRRVTLDQTGDVLVLCNIHMEMEAHILVLGDPYFATTAPDGHYRIAGVPAGTYILKIWQQHWLPFTERIELPAAGERSLDVAAHR